MIVRDWNNTLQSHIDKFTTAVGKVKERDVLLLQNQKKITELARQTQMLKNAHGEIGSNLDAIFKLQEDQHRSLDELETRLDELERRHGGSAAASSSSSSSHQHNLSLSVYSEHSMDDSERRGAYELAEHINASWAPSAIALKTSSSVSIDHSMLKMQTLHSHRELALTLSIAPPPRAHPPPVLPFLRYSTSIT